LDGAWGDNERVNEPLSEVRGRPADGPSRLWMDEGHGIHLLETDLPEDGKADQDEIRVNPWVILGEASV